MAGGLPLPPLMAPVARTPPSHAGRRGPALRTAYRGLFQQIVRL